MAWNKNSVGVKPLKKLLRTKPLAGGLLATGEIVQCCCKRKPDIDRLLTVFQEVRQCTVLETVRNTSTTDNLLADTCNHLRYVDLRTYNDS